MKRLILILQTILVLTGFTNNVTTKGNTQKIDTNKADTTKVLVAGSNVDTTFKLDFFATLPDSIDGCGEYFTYDTSKVANDKYIFLSNLTSFAIIKINGMDVYLNRDTAESKEINEKSYIAVYKGQEYKAILTIKQTKMHDEGGFYFGTKQIIGDKVKTVFKVHGEEGC